MDSESNQLPNRPPKRLRTLSSSANFSGGNSLLHRLVLDHSDAGSGHYVDAVLLSMSDVPASVVNALNDDGRSALHLAVSRNDLTMVRKLLTRLAHVDVNARCGGRDRNTALHLAVGSGLAPIVRELLDRGARIDKQNGDGDTVLQLAMSLRALDLVEILVSGKVDWHTQWNTPLHEAVSCDSLEIAEFLISRGADADPGDVFGKTPLHIAAERGNLDIAKLLVVNGADVEATYGDGETPLEKAMSSSEEIVDFLIDQGAERPYWMDEYDEEL